MIKFAYKAKNIARSKGKKSWVNSLLPFMFLVQLDQEVTESLLMTS